MKTLKQHIQSQMNNTVNAFCFMNSEVSDLPLSCEEKLKLDKLIEQDKCFSEIEFIDGVSVWKKGEEQICEMDNGDQGYARFKFRDEMIPEQFGGASFFHKVGGVDWHIRIHKGE